MVPNNITSKLFETVKLQGILITITLLLTTTVNVFSQETEKLTVVPFKEIIIKGYTPKKDGGYVIKDHYEYIKTFDPTLRIGAFSEYKLPEIDFRKYFLLGVKLTTGGSEAPSLRMEITRDQGNILKVEVDVFESGSGYALRIGTMWVLVKRKYWEDYVDFYVN
ncbi:hypothetical protein EYV94_21130 [Puteibacter caeruleilacunae]|nr:hypothetical protein EYV94_21130 [Puteibacter caeruleilacunae]